MRGRACRRGAPDPVVALRAPVDDVRKGRYVAHKDDRYEGLPATWPFRVAGTFFIAAFAWFCFGFAVKDMGDELFLSVRTVETHLRSVYAKLGVRSRTEAALWAVRFIDMEGNR